MQLVWLNITLALLISVCRCCIIHPCWTGRGRSFPDGRWRGVFAIAHFPCPITFLLMLFAISGQQKRYFSSERVLPGWPVPRDMCERSSLIEGTLAATMSVSRGPSLERVYNVLRWNNGFWIFRTIIGSMKTGECICLDDLGPWTIGDGDLKLGKEESPL